MTMQPSPDLLDLAEAVAAGTLRADDAEQQLRLALGPDRAAESEQAVRELRGLIGAAGAVRAHARATREAFGSASPDRAATDAPTPASIATLVPGRVTAGAVHRRSSNGGDGAGRAPRRTWLLAAAALLLVGGAMAAGSGLVRLPSVVPPVPAPSLPVAVASPTAGPTISAAPTEAPVVVQTRPASWAATGSMVTPRQEHTATLLPGGKVLVAGGLDTIGNPNIAMLASAELYDPSSGTWSATGNMGTARMSHTATLLADGKVLVAGGSGKGAFLASAELYDPATGSWTATRSMDTPRYNHTATLLADGKVLVAGGTGNGHILASAELYDPSTGSWTATGNMGTPRYDHTATLLPNGKVLVTGGADHGGGGCCYLTSVELYDPASGSWTAAGTLPGGGNTAARLNDGKVLVVGDLIPGPGTFAELYDPGGRTWTTTGSPVTNWAVRATLLPDGRVLLTGLIGTISQPDRTSAELYDPGSGTWAGTTSSMGDTGYRNGYTATLLPDGAVLVAGGFSDPQCAAGCTLASAGLYDPGSG